MDIGKNKKLVGLLPTGNDEDFIEIYKTDPFDPQEILSLKPTTSPLSNDEWVRHVTTFGITHAWNHDFQDYINRQFESGNLVLPRNIPRAEIPKMWAQIQFGNAGKENHKLANGNRQEYIALMTKTSWSLEQLGAFGKWIKEAEIDPNFAPEIIKEFLED